MLIIYPLLVSFTWLSLFHGLSLISIIKPTQLKSFFVNSQELCWARISGVYTIYLDNKAPLMYITTRQQLVEDEQWSRRDYVTLLISTTPGMTIKTDSVISLFVNFGWERSNAWRKTRQKANSVCGSGNKCNQNCS